jgi:prevent-host-death family protein
MQGLEMNTVSLQEAQATLPELIHRLSPGEELVITQDNRPVAKVVPFNAAPTVQPSPARNATGNGSTHGPGF